tara:strand:- start:4887 stop:5255 length:369 start_codon:yes stop_codon:yes gene_type:complete
MTTFAKVKNNIVEQVIVAEQDFIDTIPAEENVEWIKTDPSNYATIGGTYVKSRGVFTDVKQGIDWTLDDNNRWMPPIPYPVLHDDFSDLEEYYWDDELYQKDKTKGWVFLEINAFPQRHFDA